MTIQEAARRLGVKEDAIRKRIQRGTLYHEKTEEGRVFVWLDTAQDTAQDAYRDTSSRDELVDELRDQVRFLREELARKDAIMLRMAEAIPQLEAADRPPEGPRTATEPGSGTGTPPDDAGEPRRSWWQRMFGG
jgi:excisionase family DNA binding protein